MMITKFQPQQLQKPQLNQQQFQIQKYFVQNQFQQADCSMKTVDQKEASKTYRTQQEPFQEVIEYFPQNQVPQTERVNTLRQRSKTSFIKNLDIDSAKNLQTEIIQNEQNDFIRNIHIDQGGGGKSNCNPVLNSCKNSYIMPQIEYKKQYQQTNQAYVDEEEFKKYRNFIDNHTKQNKSQVLKKNQAETHNTQKFPQENIQNAYQKQEKSSLQIVLPDQSIDNAMSFGVVNDQKNRSIQQKQNSTSQLHTARSAQNLFEDTPNSRNYENYNSQKELHQQQVNAKVKPQRDNVKYQSMNFQNQQIGNDYTQQFRQQNIVTKQIEKLQTEPDLGMLSNREKIDQIKQFKNQQQEFQYDSSKQQSKVQRKSCILDQQRSDQIHIQQQLTQRQHSNNKQQIPMQNQAIQLNSHRNHQKTPDTHSNHHDNFSNLTYRNSTQTQNIKIPSNEIQHNINITKDYQNTKSLVKQHSSSNLIQNQQNMSNNQLNNINSKAYQNIYETEQKEYKQTIKGDQIQNQQLQLGQVCQQNSQTQLLQQQLEEKYKNQIIHFKEQIQSLQVHNRQLLGQIKILESDNMTSIQSIRQLQEEIKQLQSNLEISNNSKEQAQIQHQNILLQFQKLEEEIKIIREQSSKFAQDHYQNVQQQSIELKNWNNYNNISFDETSSSPFSHNNFASAKSVATTATVFSQKSSTMISKPNQVQQSNPQIQIEKQQPLLFNQGQSNSSVEQQQFYNYCSQLQNNQAHQQQPFSQNYREGNLISARDGASIFEQTFSQDDQHQFHSQESRKSQALKKNLSQENYFSQQASNKVENNAAFDILYQIYQKLGEGQFDQIELLPEKVNNLINENKQNGKFIKSMKELMMKCAPTNYFVSSEPSLKIIWKFIKKVMEEYTVLKTIRLVIFPHIYIKQEQSIVAIIKLFQQPLTLLTRAKSYIINT